MNLVVAVFVVATSGALVASLFLHVFHGPVLEHLRRIAPRERICWLFALIGTPALVGLITVLIAFGPCIRNLVLGLADGCRAHGGPEFFLCFRMPMHRMRLAWPVVLVVASLVARRVTVGMLAAIRTTRALGVLRSLGNYDGAREIWIVPGDLAIVSGWPTGRIYVGEGLERGFSNDTLRVVLAHERAHVRRRDVGIKLAAGVLGLCVPHHIREHLLGELGLAMEQACDAIAADEVADPLFVARSLLELARTPMMRPSFGLGLGCAPLAEHLEARIRALCEPRWASSRRLVAVVGAATIAIVGACLAFDPALHNFVEAAFDQFLV